MCPRAGGTHAGCQGVGSDLPLVGTGQPLGSCRGNRVTEEAAACCTDPRASLLEGWTFFAKTACFSP